MFIRRPVGATQRFLPLSSSAISLSAIFGLEMSNAVKVESEMGNNKNQDGHSNHNQHQHNQKGNMGRQRNSDRNQHRESSNQRGNMNRSGGGGGGGGGSGGGGGGLGKDMIRERLANIGPTANLTTREGIAPKKFTGRCRLFVGNLPNNTTDEDFKKMFESFGEIAEVFLNRQKGFGFVKLDTRQNAEAAKAALDFSMKDGKYLRVRFATHGAALKVKNLTPWVSNELLEAAFSIFGEVERAVVIVDDRGRPVGEGIVEYSRKQAAQLALKRCTEGCFLLTSAPKPVLVEPLEQRDEEDGFPEKNFQKNNPEYLKEREMGPRLADPGTFEFDFCNRWKKLASVERQKREHLEKEIIEGRQQLDDQQEFAICEHEANMLREKLRVMEEQSSILQREREMRREEERRREEQRHQEELMIRQQQEEILRRRSQQDEMRRRQEDTMMMQANQLSALLDRRQSRFDQPPGANMGGAQNAMAHQMAAMRGGQRGEMHEQQHHEMMDPRDLRDEYEMEAKRRRY